jgi:translation initiation factor IF-2
MPVRIYDIAKKYGIASKEVLARAKDLNITGARVPSSSLDKITAEYLEQQLELLLGIKPVDQVAAKQKEMAAAAAALGSPPVTAAPEAPIPTAPSDTVMAPTQVLEQAAQSIEVISSSPPSTVAPAPAVVGVDTGVQEPEREVSAVLIEGIRIVTAAPPPASAAGVVEGPSPATAQAVPGAEAIAESIPVELPAPLAERAETAPFVAEGSQPVVAPIPTGPPPPPPPPKVGDKVGFIQLPPKPGPRTGDKAGTSKLPPRTPSRPEAFRGRPDRKEAKSLPGVSRPTASAPVRPIGLHPGQRPAAPKPIVAKPVVPPASPFVPPASGELITMKPPIIVRHLADMLKRKPFQLIADLMELGVFANVNQSIDESAAQRLCAKHGYRFEVERRERGAGLVHAPPVKIVELDTEDKIEDLKPRPPVVTIMGHVDHGKTTLLDTIRKSDVAAGEAGGITQHIGAYTISIPHPERPKELQQITFLDTPGHAAFSAMRARGANVTDIVILVVAANDGVMPQTVEAINHAKAAKVTIIVAVNKIDHPTANPMQVRQQLQEHGLVCEEWGGNTIFQNVSALTKEGVDKLLEMLVLQAEVMELKANPTRRAKGNVIESGLEPGGPTATVLVRKGTLGVGDITLCGPFWGKVRALINEEGKRLKEAGPSVAVKLLGLNGVPEAGLEFRVVENEKMAREVAEQTLQEAKDTITSERRPKVTLEDLMATMSADSVKVLRVVVKADTQGSIEAIVDALKKIGSDKVTLEIVHSAVGTITESDVVLASASKAIVIGFHTRVDSSAADAAKREGVQIKLYSIIYELIDEVKAAMAGLLEPVMKESILGSAEVRQLFQLSKGGAVAGCMVSNGRVLRGRCRVIRRKSTVYEGTVHSLRRFQDEVNEVRSGLECGIRVEGFGEFQTGDIIECYAMEKVVQKL